MHSAHRQPDYYSALVSNFPTHTPALPSPPFDLGKKVRAFEDDTPLGTMCRRGDPSSSSDSPSLSFHSLPPLFSYFSPSPCERACRKVGR